MNRVMKRNKINSDRSWIFPVTGVVLALYSLLLVLFFIWALLSSFKANLDFSNNLFGWPRKWMFSNYRVAFENFFIQVQEKGHLRNVYMGEMFLNSILYTVGSSFAATVIPCIVGYLTAKFPYRFSRWLINITIICLIIPIIGSLPSQLQISKTMGLYDQLWGMWIMKANFMSMYLLIFNSAFKAIPDAYSEAARIDGASETKVLLSIALPLVRSLFFTIMLIQAIGFWNDYQTPMLFMPDRPTVAYGLYVFNQGTITQLNTVPFKLTAALEMMAPILIIFILFNKKIIGNVTMGGLKQ